MRVKLGLISVFFCLFLGTPVGALEIPQPRGFVNDFANVIPPAAAQKLNHLLAMLEQQADVEMAIVTLNSLEGEDIDDFTNRVFEQWGIGKKDKDNGMLILAAIQDREGRIEVGDGLKGIITDSLADQVLLEVIAPPFESGQYGKGLIDGSLVLMGMIEDATGVELQRAPQQEQEPVLVAKKPRSFYVWILRIILALVAVIILIRLFKKKRS